MQKIKTKLTIDAFLAIQFMLPPIPSPRIVQIDEGSPALKGDDLLEESLVPPSLEFIIIEPGQQLIFDLNEPPQVTRASELTVLQSISLRTTLQNSGGPTLNLLTYLEPRMFWEKSLTNFLKL